MSVKYKFLKNTSCQGRGMCQINTIFKRKSSLCANSRYAQLKKRANRTNSTFGFCRLESQRRKNQKSYFLPTLTENNEN